MIYTLNIILKNNSIITHQLDTSYLDITYSNMAERSPVSMETRKFSIGTLDGKFHLHQLWSDIKKINISDINNINLKLDNEEVYNFEDKIENIFYLINFNGPGDMISFCYGKEEDQQ